MATGRYHSPSAIVQEGLQFLEDQETLNSIKLNRLRADIQEGLDDVATGRVTHLDVEAIERLGRERLAIATGDLKGKT